MTLPSDYKPVDKNLVRGPRPDNYDMFEVLAQFKHDINLEVGWFDLFTGQSDFEQREALRSGCTYWHLPMSDILSPSAAAVTEHVRRIKLCQAQGPVLVHCLHGEDRTGIICAAYRILCQAWTPDDAIAEMYNYGFHRWAYWYWVPVLRRI